jgi:hypothetical protein
VAVLLSELITTVKRFYDAGPGIELKALSYGLGKGSLASFLMCCHTIEIRRMKFIQKCDESNKILNKKRFGF